MKNILVIGAGRSAVSLIKYLIDNALTYNWMVTVADFSEESAQKAVYGSKNGNAISFNVNNDQHRVSLITKSDIVISMLPASMHLIVAKDCIRLKKNLITASYVSREIASLDKLAKKSGVLLLNEIGLDPGIDHMSAMSVIDDIKGKGGKILSFKSYCGGLVHPEYDDNPWNYKFTWNPRNVVLAGQGISQYIKYKNPKFLPYNQLFERTNTIKILDSGEFEAYANRDSLIYRDAYGLKDIQTLFRGTLRKKGYSEAWNVFVQLGMTDDTFKVTNSECISKRQFLNMFFAYSDKLTLEQKFCNKFNLTLDSDIFKKIKWLGFFEESVIGLSNATPAQLLQKILEKKWSFGIHDKDMIIMQHQFRYVVENKQKRLNSSLVVYGEDSINTAMAKTVGLPVAIAAKLILSQKINTTGVKIPISNDIYKPVLSELSHYGINFVEEELV